MDQHHTGLIPINVTNVYLPLERRAAPGGVVWGGAGLEKGPCTPVVAVQSDHMSRTHVKTAESASVRGYITCEWVHHV